MAEVLTKYPWEMSDDEIASEFKDTGNQEAMTAQNEAVEDPDSAPLINEQHPALSVKDRAIVKNFSTDPIAAIRYLQMKYPQMDIALTPDNKIILRNEGEKNYRAVDPDSTPDMLRETPSQYFKRMLSPSGIAELGKDALDVGYDLASGVGSTIASTAAGLSAGAATGGAAAIPAAMAAGGATGSALEGARQKLGQALGIPQEVDPSQIKMAGGIGAVSPLLFGTGSTAAQAAAKATSKGLSKEGAEALANSQRGLLGRAYDSFAGTFLPKAGELISGIPSGTIKSQAKYGKEVRRLADEGIQGDVSEIHSQIKDTLGKAIKTKGEQIGSAIENAGQKVDITDVKGTLQKAIDKAKGLYEKAPTAEFKQNLDELQTAYDDIFMVSPEMRPESGIGPVKPKDYLPDQIPADVAFNLKDSLQSIAGLSKTASASLKGRNAGKATIQEKMAANNAGEAYKKLQDAIGKATESSELATGTKGLNAEYKYLINKQKRLDPFFNSPEKTYNTLRSLGGKGKRILYEELGQMDKDMGTDILKQAQVFDAYSTFVNAPMDAVSGRGVTSTSRTIPAASLGGAIGAYTGFKLGGAPGAAIGGTTGMTLGGKMASPEALKMYIRTGKGLDTAVGTVRNMGLALPTMGQEALEEATPAAWEAVRNMKGKK